MYASKNIKGPCFLKDNISDPLFNHHNPPAYEDQLIIVHFNKLYLLPLPLQTAQFFGKGLYTGMHL